MYVLRHALGIFYFAVSKNKRLQVLMALWVWIDVSKSCIEVCLEIMPVCSPEIYWFKYRFNFHDNCSVLRPR